MFSTCWGLQIRLRSGAMAGKTCSVCGASGYNLRSCLVPGAQTFRKFLAAQRTSRRAASFGAPRGRLRWARVAGLKDKKKSYKDTARKEYAGTPMGHNAWRDRKWKGGALSDSVTDERAIEKLPSAGFMKTGGDCPRCATGGLHGPVQRPQHRSLYYMCDSCRIWTNAMALGCRTSVFGP